MRAVSVTSLFSVPAVASAARAVVDVGGLRVVPSFLRVRSAGDDRAEAALLEDRKLPPIRHFCICGFFFCA